eukprot:COSAG06_NODE_585_length_14005_cov_13.777938_9_plen_81_part_00
MPLAMAFMDLKTLWTPVVGPGEDLDEVHMWISLRMQVKTTPVTRDGHQFRMAKKACPYEESFHGSEDLVEHLGEARWWLR